MMYTPEFMAVVREFVQAGKALRIACGTEVQYPNEVSVDWTEFRTMVCVKSKYGSGIAIPLDQRW